MASTIECLPKVKTAEAARVVDRSTSTQPTGDKEATSWLLDCQKAQDEVFPELIGQNNNMGLWELDLHHQEIECYNAYLFTRMQPSSQEERQSSEVYGYGTVLIQTICDKDSTVPRWIEFENVKYVRRPRDTNHRIGKGALPTGTQLHLPNTDVTGHGDGFLSMGNNNGCAIARLKQGGRGFWALRTFDIQKQRSLFSRFRPATQTVVGARSVKKRSFNTMGKDADTESSRLSKAARSDDSPMDI